MFEAKDRQIFVYKIDGKEINCDPDILQRRMRKQLNGPQGGLDLAKAFDNAFGKEGFTPSPEEEDAAIEEIVKLAKATFGVEELSPEGKGLTRQEMVDLIMDYIAYVEAAKKKDVSSGNSSNAAGNPPNE